MMMNIITISHNTLVPGAHLIRNEHNKDIAISIHELLDSWKIEIPLTSAPFTSAGSHYYDVKMQCWHCMDTVELGHHEEWEGMVNCSGKWAAKNRQTKAWIAVGSRWQQRVARGSPHQSINTMNTHPAAPNHSRILLAAYENRWKQDRRIWNIVENWICGRLRGIALRRS